MIWDWTIRHNNEPSTGRPTESGGIEVDLGDPPLRFKEWLFSPQAEPYVDFIVTAGLPRQRGINPTAIPRVDTGKAHYQVVSEGSMWTCKHGVWGWEVIHRNKFDVWDYLPPEGVSWPPK